MFEREFTDAKTILSGLQRHEPPAEHRAEVTSLISLLEANLSNAEAELARELGVSAGAHRVIDELLATDVADVSSTKGATRAVAEVVHLVSAADDVAVANLSTARGNLRFLLTQPNYQGDAAFTADIAKITEAVKTLLNHRLHHLIQQLEVLAPAIGTAAKQLKGTVTHWKQVIDGVKAVVQALGLVVQVLAFL